MNKKILITVLVLLILVLVGGGYYYWKTNMQKSPAEQAVDDLQKTVKSIGDAAAQGVMPAIDTTINPMENAPDTNPYSNTNPFSDVKVNPFE
ncbi:MAG: hypothetical protein ACYC3G_03755 [Minisyncoccota bacterium]